LCGAEKIGRPIAPTGYRPEAWRVAPFTVPGEAPAPSPVQPDPGGEEVGARLAVRAIRPPRRAQVFCDAGSIVYVRAAGLGGRAVVAGGPWRIEAEWWTDSPCRRDYYDVQLSDGGVYRLYRDLRADGSRRHPSTDDDWFIDGWYD
jgi:protein ImuB